MVDIPTPRFDSRLGEIVVGVDLMTHFWTIEIEVEIASRKDSGENFIPRVRT
jgi:hypothetical protein